MQNKIYSLTGNSMWPFLRHKDSVIVVPANEKAIFKHDIIVYRKGLMLVCHRIIKVKHSDSSRIYYVKGDYSRRIDILGWNGKKAGLFLCVMKARRRQSFCNSVFMYCLLYFV